MTAPVASAASVVVGDHGTAQSVGTASEVLPPKGQPDRSDWVVKADDIFPSAASAAVSEQKRDVASTIYGVKAPTVDPVNALDVAEALKAVTRLESSQKTRVVMKADGSWWNHPAPLRF